MAFANKDNISKNLGTNRKAQEDGYRETGQSNHSIPCTSIMTTPRLYTSPGEATPHFVTISDTFVRHRKPERAGEAAHADLGKPTGLRS